MRGLHLGGAVVGVHTRVLHAARGRTLGAVATERIWLVATRAAAGLMIALFAVLLATGVALTFRYRPTVTAAYANAGAHASSGVTARSVHRLASVLFVPAALVFSIASIGLFLARRRAALIVLPLATVGLAVVAGVTGYLLPWDQLALRAVTAGTDLRGYRSILSGEQVRFVLVGNSTITTATFARWYWVHALVVPLLVVGVVAAVVITTRRARSPRSPDRASS